MNVETKNEAQQEAEKEAEMNQHIDHVVKCLSDDKSSLINAFAQHAVCKFLCDIRQLCAEDVYESYDYHKQAIVTLFTEKWRSICRMLTSMGGEDEAEKEPFKTRVTGRMVKKYETDYGDQLVKSVASQVCRLYSQARDMRVSKVRSERKRGYEEYAEDSTSKQPAGLARKRRRYKEDEVDSTSKQPAGSGCKKRFKVLYISEISLIFRQSYVCVSHRC